MAPAYMELKKRSKFFFQLFCYANLQPGLKYVVNVSVPYVCVLTTSSEQSEDQQPKTFVSQSGKPAVAATEAKPIRKLWPFRLR